MSSWARSWAYEQCVGEQVGGEWRRNPGAKSVLAAICEFPDQDGRCYVGQETLAQMTDMGVRTIRRHLSFLEEHGWIEREERRRKDGTRTSDYIWVLAPPERLRPPQPAKSAGRQPSTNATTGQIRHTNRPDSTHQPANLAAPYIEEPSVDPLVDPSERDAAEEKRPKLRAVTPLSSDMQDAVNQLLSIKNWDVSKDKTIEIVGEAAKNFPQINILATATNLAFKMKVGAVQYKKPSRAFANWVSNDADKQEEAPRRRGPAMSDPSRIRQREIT